MSTEFVKRKINIQDFDEDVFSDEIKTTAIIEEIEAAELAARQAKIEQEIEASQPNMVVRIQRKVAGAWQKVRGDISVAKETMATKVPEDPRVKKVSYREKVQAAGGYFGDFASRAAGRGQGVIKNMKQVAGGLKKRTGGYTEKKAARPTIDPKKAQRHHAKTARKNGNEERLGGLARINSLTPEGVSLKTVVESSIAAALIVIAGELWAWNLSHPLFEKNQVTNVPITGRVETTTDENSDNEVQKEQTTEVNPPAETTAEENVAPSTEGETTNHGGNWYGNNYGGGGYTRNNSSGTQDNGQRQQSAKPVQASPSQPNSQKNNSVHVDSQWDDSMNDWLNNSTDEGEARDTGGDETETNGDDTEAGAGAESED